MEENDYEILCKERGDVKQAEKKHLSSQMSVCNAIADLPLQSKQFSMRRNSDLLQADCIIKDLQ